MNCILCTLYQFNLKLFQLQNFLKVEVESRRIIPIIFEKQIFACAKYARTATHTYIVLVVIYFHMKRLLIKSKLKEIYVFKLKMLKSLNLTLPPPVPFAVGQSVLPKTLLANWKRCSRISNTCFVSISLNAFSQLCFCYFFCRLSLRESLWSSQFVSFV